MMRRSSIIAVLAAGFMAAAVHSVPAYSRFVSSAQSVQRYLRDLEAAGTSLSPVERLVFSLVLANTKAPAPQQTGAARARRT